MKTAAQNWSFTAWLRDRAYDTVFHVGDTALQFTADLIRGPDNMRQQSYTRRQLEKQARRSSPAIKKSKSEKPLNFEEKKIFTQMIRRQSGESLIQHWKRRKELLQHPDKRGLIAIKQRMDARAENLRPITVKRKAIATESQQTRLRKKSRSRKRPR